MELSEYIRISTVGPGNGDALEEDEEEQTHSACRVRVEQLEDVHTSLPKKASLLPGSPSNTCT